MSLRRLPTSAILTIVFSVALSGAIAMLAGTSNRPAEQSYDVVITNGRVMDPESGLDANRNIGLRAGKIAAISEKPLSGKTTIDAKGLVVAPGFIDLHEHGQEP